MKESLMTGCLHITENQKRVMRHAYCTSQGGHCQPWAWRTRNGYGYGGLAPPMALGEAAPLLCGCSGCSHCQDMGGLRELRQ